LAARNFKLQTGSLRTFLRTSKLGPISLDLPLLEVAALIGPPNWWATDVHDFPFPLNLGYAGLEISFSVEPPHMIEWFKVDPAQLKQTRYHRFCASLQISLEDIPISGRPSMLLASDIWDADAVAISFHCRGHEPRMIVSVGYIELLYVIYDQDIPKFADLSREKPDSAIPLLDEHAVLHGIYIGSDPTALGNRWPTEPWHTVSVQEYLLTVAGRSVSPA
jgi:hypothetical protein